MSNVCGCSKQDFKGGIVEKVSCCNDTVWLTLHCTKCHGQKPISAGYAKLLELVGRSDLKPTGESQNTVSLIEHELPGKLICCVNFQVVDMQEYKARLPGPSLN